MTTRHAQPAPWAATGAGRGPRLSPAPPSPSASPPSPALPQGPERDTLGTQPPPAARGHALPLPAPRAKAAHRSTHNPDLFICAQQREMALLPGSILQSNASHSIVTVFHDLLGDFQVFHLKEQELWREGRENKELSGFHSSTE